MAQKNGETLKCRRRNELRHITECATEWQMYIAKFGLDAKQARPDDNSWTGAEIRACCRLAALLDVPLKAAGANVVPVAATAAESVERLRNWASGRCLDAESGGIYRPGKSEGPRRKIRRDISMN